jgi:hypothetical protein
MLSHGVSGLGGNDNKRHSDVIAREREWVPVFDAIGVRDHREAKCRRRRAFDPDYVDVVWREDL